MAGIQVDDAQAPHPDRRAGIHEDAFVIRPAMADHVAHLVNEPPAIVDAERRDDAR